MDLGNVGTLVLPFYFLEILVVEGLKIWVKYGFVSRLKGEAIGDKEARTRVRLDFDVAGI